MADSFLFYDLETFGQDPRRTRISQFAAIRTDADLNEIDTPVSFFVRRPMTCCPRRWPPWSPASPRKALAEGISESQAFDRINELMSRPGTCALGYNTLRFDDEFVRYGLFRNFHDPYEREWRNGNSRWDLLDMLRLMRAMRPDGIQCRCGGRCHLVQTSSTWPKPTTCEGDAHEALSDVRATIGMARLFKQSQPRLWDYALKLRDKRFVGTAGCHHDDAGAAHFHALPRQPSVRGAGAALGRAPDDQQPGDRVRPGRRHRRPAGPAGRGDRTAPVPARQ